MTQAKSNNFQDDAQEIVNTAIFVGRKGSGKTTVRRWIIEDFREDPGKPTVGLDYSYGKKLSTMGDPDAVVNLYEIGGGAEFANLIDVPLTPYQLPMTSFVITLDLTNPQLAFQDLMFWTELIETRVEECKQILEKSDPKEAEEITGRAYKLKKTKGVHSCGLPIFVFCTHYDVFENKFDQAQKRCFSDAIRYFATFHHQFVAYIRHSKDCDSTNKAIMFLRHSLLPIRAPAVKNCTSSDKQLLFTAGAEDLADVDPTYGKDSAVMSAQDVVASSVNRQFPREKVKEDKKDILNRMDINSFKEPSLDTLLSEMETQLSGANPGWSSVFINHSSTSQDLPTVSSLASTRSTPLIPAPSRPIHHIRPSYLSKPAKTEVKPTTTSRPKSGTRKTVTSPTPTPTSPTKPANVFKDEKTATTRTSKTTRPPSSRGTKTEGSGSESPTPQPSLSTPSTKTQRPASPRRVSSKDKDSDSTSAAPKERPARTTKPAPSTPTPTPASADESQLSARRPLSPRPARKTTSSSSAKQSEPEETKAADPKSSTKRVVRRVAKPAADDDFDDPPLASKRTSTRTSEKSGSETRTRPSAGSESGKSVKTTSTKTARPVPKLMKADDDLYDF
ncbi:putative Cytoplasmic dynein 2 light intermediate chain 1 [Blattamonas nauphoetae]|uniref:Cytoplasmic dynein 2 light intermediate chain 1 n=1 Tax=Blattamonas nauphoetae TaxID=2049346 RepID=A0ABQ9XCS1_9EUKA|nr:putative Cytoplasmic dynein 2 light intermediate chain 1 [Blattamonas nauphoetae]